MTKTEPITMKERFAKYKRCRSGATLIIILVMVCMVTILVIGYLGTVRLERSATQSYSARVGAEEIALGGLDRVVADFQQEIAAGSTSNGPASHTSYSNWQVYYQPKSYLSMVPARFTDTGNGATAAYTNLVRVSASSTANYSAAYSGYTSAPVNLAVASPTTNPAPNGSYISTNRWSMPQLLTTNEIMPVPDWILTTRSGPITPAKAASAGFTVTANNSLNNPIASNTNYVIGRYAYAVYNEGGLIDVTVAGAPAVSSSDDIGNRGSLAFAPLNNSILTATQATALANWRNLTTATNSAPGETNYEAYVYGVVTNAATPGTFTTNAAATNGFLLVQPGDNTFLSRQDLISYANYAGITNALPYLGTFSRDLNAPAYTPAPAPTGTPNYSNAAMSATNPINPDVMTIRFSSGGAVNSGGSLLTSTNVVAGQFFLRQRFPLSRLSWITYNGTTGAAVNNYASATDIWHAFGLVYSTGNDTTSNSWVYTSGDGTSIPSGTLANMAISIKYLGQVASESSPRDPDFFELLKAGILSGSLGLTSGSQATYQLSAVNGTSVSNYGETGDTVGFDSVKDYQIIQIGANILNQANPANFPIAISFGGERDSSNYVSADNFLPSTSSSNNIYTGPRTFYGVANLPYINRMLDTYVRFSTAPGNYPAPSQTAQAQFYIPASGFTTTNTYADPWVGTWIQVELWNPHQTANLNTSSGFYPYAVRFLGTGTLQGHIYSRETSGAQVANAYAYPDYSGVSSHMSSSVSVSTGLLPNTNQSENQYQSNPSPVVPTTWLMPSSSPTTSNTSSSSGQYAYVQLNPVAGTITNFSEPRFVGTSDTAATYCAPDCYQSGNNLVNGSSTTDPSHPVVGLFVGASWAPDWEYSAHNSGGGNFNTNSSGNPVPVTFGSGNAMLPYTNLNATATNDPLCVSYEDARIDPNTSTKTNPGVTYQMQYLDYSNGTWRNYGLVKNQTLESLTGMPTSSPSSCNWTVLNSFATSRYNQVMDPRTDRFSTSKASSNEHSGSSYSATMLFPTNTTTVDATVRPDNSVNDSISDSFLPYGPATPLGVQSGDYAGSIPVGTPNWYQANGTAMPYPNNGYSTTEYLLSGIMDNLTNNGAYDSPIYYNDPDTVLRRGDGAYSFPTSGSLQSGHPGIANSSLPKSSSINLARPIILNRPLRSVGELGFACRDLPWKTLDFFTKDSADAGLLDLFSVTDAPVVAGRIDLNTRNAQALAEVLYAGQSNPIHSSPSTTNDPLSWPLSSAQANDLAQAMVASTISQPVRSRAELVTEVLATDNNETVPVPENVLADNFKAWSTDSPYNLKTGQDSKIQREAPIRTLSEAGNARTWNLMVDIIAQSGHFPPSASSYSSFVPDGEKRYWLHIAIDRYTGQVIDRYLEPVQE